MKNSFRVLSIVGTVCSIVGMILDAVTEDKTVEEAVNRIVDEKLSAKERG